MSAAEAAARDASVFRQLNEGLKRSSSRLAEGLAGLSKRRIDREALDELEEILITSDMGAKVAARIAKAFSKDRFDRELKAHQRPAGVEGGGETLAIPRRNAQEKAGKKRNNRNPNQKSYRCG